MMVWVDGGWLSDFGQLFGRVIAGAVVGNSLTLVEDTGGWGEVCLGMQVPVSSTS